MRRRLISSAILGASLAALLGCAATQPSTFYVLSSLADSGVQTQARAGNLSPVIGVGPVELAQYLDRPQIVTRASQNKLNLAEFDKWAEPLNENIARVLAENLSILLPTERVLVYPWGAAPVQYRVEMRVTRLDAGADRDVSVVAYWSVQDDEERRIVASRKSTFVEPAGGADFEALVSAMSRNLEQLSQEVAAAIKNAEKERAVMRQDRADTLPGQ